MPPNPENLKPFQKGGDPRIWKGGRPKSFSLSDVFQEPITQTHSDGLHNHSKPADWVTLLIANCTAGVVFDPFVGAGTSVVACERVGRQCIAIDIDPKSIAVTLQRWADMTARGPVLL
jgi:hypothetical protein